MNLSEAKKLQIDIIQTLSQRNLRNRHAISKSRVRIPSFLPENVRCEFAGFLSVKERSNMFAVGYSKVNTTQFRLEIRIRDVESQAGRLALRMKEVLGNDLNVLPVRGLTAAAKAIDHDPMAASSAESSSNKHTLTPGHEEYCKIRNPLHIGLSIGHERGSSGTLGAFFSDRPDGQGDLFLLSCNHVLALCGKAKEKDPIFQPGWSEGLVPKPVAILHAAVRLKKANNRHDLALAKLPDSLKGQLRNETPEDAGTPRKRIRPPVIEPLEINDQVSKFGRTTGERSGRVSSLGIIGMKIDYSQFFPGKRRHFGFSEVIEVCISNKDMIKSRYDEFAREGDSGSLVIRELDGELHALGLVFATGLIESEKGRREMVAYCSPIESPLKINGHSYYFLEHE